MNFLTYMTKITLAIANEAVEEGVTITSVRVDDLGDYYRVTGGTIDGIWTQRAVTRATLSASPAPDGVIYCEAYLIVSALQMGVAGAYEKEGERTGDRGAGTPRTEDRDSESDSGRSGQAVPRARD